jgi:hypothetical protein
MLLQGPRNDDDYSHDEAEVPCIPDLPDGLSMESDSIDLDEVPCRVENDVAAEFAVAAHDTSGGSRREAAAAVRDYNGGNNMRKAVAIEHDADGGSRREAAVAAHEGGGRQEAVAAAAIADDAAAGRRGAGQAAAGQSRQQESAAAGPTDVAGAGAFALCQLSCRHIMYISTQALGDYYSVFTHMTMIPCQGFNMSKLRPGEKVACMTRDKTWAHRGNTAVRQCFYD